MSEKTFKIVNGNMSDGYHTFDELYEHRCLLYLTWLVEEKKYGGQRAVFYKLDHFPGWDLVATHIGGQQVSYHLPLKYRDIVMHYFTPRADLESVWDGHSSSDVVKRLESRMRDYD